MLPEWVYGMNLKTLSLRAELSQLKKRQMDREHRHFPLERDPEEAKSTDDAMCGNSYEKGNKEFRVFQDLN